MVSSRRISSIAIFCTCHSASTLHQVERGREKTTKVTENDIEWRACSQKSDAFHTNSSVFFFSVTQSFLLGFSWSSDDITVSKKKSPFKKEPTSISEITISYLHQNIIIPLLCQCGLFIHTCVSTNSVMSKDVIFYLFWYDLMRWSSHVCKKNLLFSHSLES